MSHKDSYWVKQQENDNRTMVKFCVDRATWQKINNLICADKRKDIGTKELVTLYVCGAKEVLA